MRGRRLFIGWDRYSQNTECDNPRVSGLARDLI